MTNTDYPSCPHCGMTTDPAAGGHAPDSCDVFLDAQRKIIVEEYIKAGKDKEDKDRRKGKR